MGFDRGASASSTRSVEQSRSGTWRRRTATRGSSRQQAHQLTPEGLADRDQLTRQLEFSTLSISRPLVPAQVQHSVTRNIARKLWTGGSDRSSRFHDALNNVALQSPRMVLDCAFSLVTAAVRYCFNYRLPVPWITLDAWRFLKKHLKPDARIFEWGSGMSTLWYERHYAEVHSVENDGGWFATLSGKARKAHLYLLDGSRYAEKIRDFPAEYFDLIVVDGIDRLRCLKEASRHLKRSGLLMIDNTDWPDLNLAVRESRGFEIHRLTGWAPGNFFAQQTTILTKQHAAAQTD